MEMEERSYYARYTTNQSIKRAGQLLEARLTRYEELLHGSVLKRIIFGEGGEQSLVFSKS